MSVFEKLPIRYKLLLKYVPVTLAIFVLFYFFLYYEVSDYIRTGINNELGKTTQLVKTIVSSSATASIKNNLRAVAEKNYQIMDYYFSQIKSGKLSEKEAQKALAGIIASQKIGKTGYIFCIDDSGVVFMHPNKSMIGRNVSEYSFVRNILKQKEGYFEYDWKNDNEKKARHKAIYIKYFAPLDLIIAVSSYRDEFKDLINIEDFDKEISSIKFFKTGYVFVCDTLGKSLIHPELKGTNGINVKDANGKLIIKELCSQRQGYFYYSWKNNYSEKVRDKIVIFDYLPEYGWIVASSAYMDEVYEPINKMILISVFLGIVTLIIIFGFLYKISLLITKPITTLIPKFAAGSAGDFKTRCEVTTTDELGDLYKYFNEFMGKFETFSAELIESEDKYRTIFENSLEGMFKLSGEGDLIASNPAFAALLGYSSPEDLNSHGFKIYDLIDDNNEHKSDFIEKMFSGEVISNYIINFKKLYFEEICLSINARASFDRNGDLIHIYGYAEDYTERRENEKKLLETHRLLMDIIEFLPDPTFVIDKEGAVVAWNNAIVKLTGVGKAQMIGKSDMEYSLAFYKNKHPLLIDYFLNKEAFSSKEYESIEFKDSSIFAEAYIELLNIHAWGTASALIDKAGNVYGAIESIRDISVQKNAEILLKKSEEKYREVVETANEGITILQDAVVKYTNNKISELFEYSREELYNKPFLSLIHPEDKQMVAENYKSRLLNKDIIGAYTFRVVSKSGEYIWIETKSVMINFEGAPASLAFLTDISDRVKAENEIKLLNSELETRVKTRTEELNYALSRLESSNIELQTLNEHLAHESKELILLNDKLYASENKLKEANETKDKFFSIIAHDLRNPFGGIKGLMNMLYENYSQFSDDERMRYLYELVKSSDKVSLLLENLLTWSLTQRGKLDFSPTLFDIYRVTDQTLSTVQVSAQQKNILLENLIPRGLRISGDTNMITTVIRNLITNAIKFTRDKGFIRCSIIEFDDYIEYRVTDNGVGMSDDIKNKLFKIGVPSSQLGSAKEKGSGLGLIICKEFVEKHGGTIRVESEPDKGSSFIFTLKKNI